MEEESRVSKLFFTVASNGNNDLQWQEINMINDINITPNYYDEYERISTVIYEDAKSISFSCGIDKDSMKRFEKDFGLNHISKKRAKKLLMSRGWSRNEANKIIEEHTMPRTKTNIYNYGIKLTKVHIKI